jgi:hypothetical protein
MRNEPVLEAGGDTFIWCHRKGAGQEVTTEF